VSEDEKITVKIDPDLEDLIPGYIENRHKDIRAMEEALAKGEFETVRVLGHSMKGSGGGYGFDGITEIGRSLEQAAKGGDAAAMRRGIDALADYMKRVEVVYAA
jgi:HPt (histidine-containing phosphotransfer) domain-containing protein